MKAVSALAKVGLVLVGLVGSGCFCGSQGNRSTCVTGGGFCVDGGASNCVSLCTVACSDYDFVESCASGCSVETIPSSGREDFLASRKQAGVARGATTVAVCGEDLPADAGADGGP